MYEVYEASGSAAPVVLGASGVVLAAALLQALCWLLRWRPPAFFFWFLPAVTLCLAGGAAWMGWDGADAIWRPLPASPPNANELYAAGMRAAPIALSGYALAAALSLGGLLLALPNSAGGSTPCRWTPKHTLSAFVVAVPSMLTGLASGWAFGIAVCASVAIPIASLRIAQQGDGRRMAAGRGFVGSMFVGAALCLGLAETAHLLHRRLVAWADGVPFVESSTPVVAAVVLACLLILATMVSMLPHAKRVLDGRGALGLIFSLFLLAPVAIAVVPPLESATRFARPNPAANRQLALRTLGIDLVSIAGQPWTAGPALTVGAYWAYWQGERVLPFRGGRVPSSKLLDGMAVDLLDRFTPITDGHIDFEVDRRVDFLRLRPLLRAAQEAELHQVGFVTRTETGQLQRLQTSIAPAPEDGVHILLSPDSVIWIDGDDAHPVAVSALQGQRFVLHVDDDTLAPLLFQVIAGAAEVTLWL